MMRQYGCVQELTNSVEVLREDSEASSAALREAQAALEERHASAVQRESALEAETADLEARNAQLTTQAEAAHSECCRYSCIPLRSARQHPSCPRRCLRGVSCFFKLVSRPQPELHQVKA